MALPPQKETAKEAKLIRGRQFFALVLPILLSVHKATGFSLYVYVVHICVHQASLETPSPTCSVPVNP